jgi:hypothetical protein
VKWGVAALLVAAAAWLLVRASDSSVAWAVTRSAGSASASLSLQADVAVHGWTHDATPVLNIRCGAGVIGLSLQTGIPVEVDEGDMRTVSVRFDSEPDELRKWFISANRQVLTAPAVEAQAAVQKMLNAERLSIAFLPLRADAAVARFSVGNFAQYWDQIKAECP